MPRSVESEPVFYATSAENKKKPTGDVFIQIAREVVENISETKSKPRQKDKRKIPEVLKRIFPPAKDEETQQYLPLKEIQKTFQELKSRINREVISKGYVKNSEWFGSIPLTEETRLRLQNARKSKKDTSDYSGAREISNSYPKDERNAKLISRLFEDPQNGQQYEDIIKETAENLAFVVVSTGFTSSAGREATKILQQMRKQYPNIEEVTAIADLFNTQADFFYDIELDSIDKKYVYEVSGEEKLIQDSILQIEAVLDNSDHYNDPLWLEEYEVQVGQMIEAAEKSDMPAEQRVLLRKVKSRLSERRAVLLSETTDGEADDLRKEDNSKQNKTTFQRFPDEDASRISFERLSDFELTDERIERLYDDPHGEAETLMRQVREELERADQEGAESIQRIIGLYQKRITLADVNKDVEVYLRRKGYFERMTPEQISRFVEVRTRQLQEVKDILNYRMGSMYASYIIQKTGNPENAMKALSNIGTLGFHHLLQQEGGLVDVVYQKYIGILRDARRDENGRLRRFTSEVYKEVRQQLLSELNSERNLYNEFYSRTTDLEEDPLEDLRSEEERKVLQSRRNLTEEDLRAIMLLAEDAAVISQQDLIPLLRARKPLPYNENNRASYIVEKAQEGIIESMDLIRHMERYTRLSPGQKAMLRMSSLMAANSTGIGVDIDDKLRDRMNRQGLKQGSPEAMEFLQNYFNGSIDQMRQFYVVDMKTGSKLETNFPDGWTWKDVTDEQIFYALKVQFGESVIASFPGHVDYFSSTYRIQEYVSQLNLMYTGDRSINAKGIGMGFRLRIAGAKLLGAESHDDLHHAEHDLHEIWHEIAEYRPQQILDAFLDGDNKRANELFSQLNKEHYSGMKDTDDSEITKPHQLVDVLNRRHQIIQQKLFARGLPQINYEHDFFSGRNSEDQQQQLVVVREVVTTLGDDSEKSYLETMKELTEFFTTKDSAGKTILDDLTNIEFRDLYKYTLFIDAPLHLQFDPSRAPGTKTLGRSEDPDVIDIGSIFTIKGMGEKDVFVRSWGDALIGKEVPQTVFTALDPDKKKHMQAIEKLLSFVPSLGGEKQLQRGSMYLSGGYMKLGTVKKLHDWMFMEALKDSAPMKEWFGPHAEVLGLAERHEMASDLALVLRSLPEDVAKESAEWFEAYLGLKAARTRDGKVVYFSSLPYNLYKARLGGLLIGGILFTTALNQAMQGFTGDAAPAPPSHGGGGGH